MNSYNSPGTDEKFKLDTQDNVRGKLMSWAISKKRKKYYALKLYTERKRRKGSLTLYQPGCQ